MKDEKNPVFALQQQKEVLLLQTALWSLELCTYCIIIIIRLRVLYCTFAFTGVEVFGFFCFVKPRARDKKKKGPQYSSKDLILIN